MVFPKDPGHSQRDLWLLFSIVVFSLHAHCPYEVKAIAYETTDPN